MKDATKMTDSQIFHWLKKTAKSISNRPVSCSLNSERGQDLVDRFEELRYEALIRGGVWHDFCVSDNSDPTHDGYDRFA